MENRPQASSATLSTPGNLLQAAAVQLQAGNHHQAAESLLHAFGCPATLEDLAAFLHAGPPAPVANPRRFHLDDLFSQGALRAAVDARLAILVPPLEKRLRSLRTRQGNLTRAIARGGGAEAARQARDQAMSQAAAIKPVCKAVRELARLAAAAEKRART